MKINPTHAKGAANPNSKWTQEDRDEIAHLLRKGQTARQIAARFARSKGAIIGVVFRDKTLKETGFAREPGENLCIPRPRKSIAASSGDRRKAMRGGIVSKNRLKPAPEIALAKPVPVAPQTAGIPLMDLGPHQCRFCINEPEQGANAHLFCGEVTEPGKSWCAWHEQSWGAGERRARRQPSRARRGSRHDHHTGENTR